MFDSPTAICRQIQRGAETSTLIVPAVKKHDVPVVRYKICTKSMRNIKDSNWIFKTDLVFHRK